MATINSASSKTVVPHPLRQFGGYERPPRGQVDRCRRMYIGERLAGGGKIKFEEPSNRRGQTLLPIGNRHRVPTGCQQPSNGRLSHCDHCQWLSIVAPPRRRSTAKVKKCLSRKVAMRAVRRLGISTDAASTESIDAEL
uniref:Uncharacterized protein n=1 Tax=Trichuris muris TaxID=70415 RepID=A0A5S6QBL8_TRIMR